MVYIIGALSTIAWIWLIVIAFKSDAIIWGVVMILFMPAALLFGLLHWDKASVPFILLVVSIALIFTLSPQEVAQFQ